MIVRQEAEADLSIEAKNLRWATELDGLTQRVEKIFVEESRKHEPPSKDAYKTVAITLMAVRARVKAVRKDITKKPRSGARASARDLLRHLEPIRQNLAGQIAVFEPIGASTPALVVHYSDQLKLLDAAAQAVVTLLPELKKPPKPILIVAQEAQKAWAKANNGAAPKSKDPAGPLVNVIARALALVGIHQSKETVSAVLKGRR